MATNPYVNKVVFGNSTVMDISDTDATEADVTSGKVFYKGSGARSVGTADYYSPSDTAETTIADDDYFPYYDSSATAKRKSLWSNIKSVLKTYFDTLYVSKTSKDEWTGFEVAVGGEVTFSGLNDTAPYNTAYKPYYYTTSAQNYYAKLKTVTGESTSNMSLTYTTDAPSGTSFKLRIIKS